MQQFRAWIARDPNTAVIVMLVAGLVVGGFVGLVAAGGGDDEEIARLNANWDSARADANEYKAERDQAESDRDSAVAEAEMWRSRARGAMRDAEPEPEPVAEPEPEPEPKPDPEPEPRPDPLGKVRTALDDVSGPVEDPNVTSVKRRGQTAVIKAKTPTGGFEGPSTGDMNGQAGAIFAAVYGEASWGHNAEVEFVGGLVDSRTGEEKPNAATGRYSITVGDARSIDWSDNDRIDYVIDWSLYREFAHPALKLDD